MISFFWVRAVFIPENAKFRSKLSFSQTFVPPNFRFPKLSQWNFCSLQRKVPTKCLVPQFHFSSSSLNQNPNSLNFTSLQFHWIKTLILPISLFNIEEPISLVPNGFPFYNSIQVCSSRSSSVCILYSVVIHIFGIRMVCSCFDLV